MRRGRSGLEEVGWRCTRGALSQGALARQGHRPRLLSPPRVLVAALLATAACAPRFEGSGQFLVPPPQAPQGEQGLEATLPPEEPSGPTTASAPVAAPSAPRPAAPTPLRRASGGTQTIRRGGVVRVGGIFPESGGLSALGKAPKQAADAYFRHLNASGGIDGTRIQFVTCDDKADDTQSTACARKLVEQDGVFIMGPSFTPFSITLISYLEQAGVPWVGYDGINIEGFQKPNVVTLGAPIEPMAHALLPYWHERMTRELGRPPNRLGAVVLDSAPAKTYMREARQVICPKLGCTFAREVPVTFTTTDYGTICSNFQQDRVDSVWIVTDPASAIKLFASCGGIGYTPPAGWLGQHGIYLDLTLEQSPPSADGTFANSALLPDTVDAPATREMVQIVRTYYRDASFGYFAALGYASARLVEDVLREAMRGGADLTRSGVLEAASRMTAYDCHGLCRAVNLRPPAASTGGNHNVWIVRAAAKRWVAEAGPIDAWTQPTWPRPGRP